MIERKPGIAGTVQMSNFYFSIVRRLYHLPKPTIAAVQGNAYGGGVGLIACCDIVVAYEQANFALTEVKLGLIPATIGPYVVSAIGEREARRLFLTGEAFSARLLPSCSRRLPTPGGVSNESP